MPWQRAPGRRRQSLLVWILQRHRQIDVDDQQLANETDIADAEALGGDVRVRDPQSRKCPAQGFRCGVDDGVVMRLIALAANAPAICEHIGIEQIGDGHA